MFCTKCGARNGDTSAFCIQCGTSLQSVPQPVPAQQNNYYPSASGSPMYQAPVMTAQAVSPAAKKPNYTLIGIISVAAVAVIIVVIVLLSLGGGKSLVGTWISEDYGAENTITFRKDGIVVVESMGYEETAEYKVKGNKLTILIDGDEETAEFRITREKGKTVLILMMDGEEMILYKK